MCVFWFSNRLYHPTSHLHILCLYAALQMSVQDANMSSDTDMSKVFEDCWGPSASEGPQKQDLTVFLQYNV
jgi:hypothetical protein